MKPSKISYKKYACGPKSWKEGNRAFRLTIGYMQLFKRSHPWGAETDLAIGFRKSLWRIIRSISWGMSI